MSKNENYLVIDIGNTRIKITVFSNDKIVFSRLGKSFLVRELRGIAENFPFTNIIYSSVRTKEPGFLGHLIRNYSVLSFDKDVALPIKNMYETPATLGMDRLAAAVGAYNKFPGENILVIDMGTCIKYDFLNAKGEFMGGNIAPGLEMRLESMHAMTSALPRVKAKFNADLIGKTTSEAMQNGAVWGIKLEIEQFIKTLTAKVGQLRVILSGGDSKYFGEILESRIFVHPELVSFGLYNTLKYNILKSGN
ncbi:MAG: type III pantothenate kinase [Chitinophagia bacterium]|jgi:type III pantothenate kinase|nr:type III pantothenate kinase [Chitinophagia bacterium]